MAHDNTPAARTANGPMFLAAVEQNEPPDRRLVTDDLAAAFLPMWLRLFAMPMRLAPIRRAMVRAVDKMGPGLWVNLACRKRYIDDKLESALPDIGVVVILGAGLDTRGYRLAHRCSIPVYELDLPVNIARKRTAVKRALGGLPATVHLVSADLETDDFWQALVDNGFTPEEPTFFVWEGVTQYLSAEAVRGVMSYLQQAAPGSRLVFTYIRDDFIRGVQMHGAHLLHRRFRGRRGVWRFGLSPHSVAGFVAEQGWHMVEQAGPDYLEHHYVRPTGRGLRASQIEWSVYAEKR